MKKLSFILKPLVSIILLWSLLVFTNCDKEEFLEEENLSDTIVTNENNIEVEKAYPNTSGEVTEIIFEGQKLPVEKIDDHYVFEGDIIISEEELNASKSTGRTSRLWPNCTIYYTIQNSLPNKQRVYDAIAHWEANTNFQFIKRTNQVDYVYFRTGTGCSSRVGRIGGKQEIKLSNLCSTGNTIHEIGHAIGLWHEHSRKDRNAYVTINYANIESEKDHNFKTYIERGYDGDEYSPSLDFGSIMMYGSYAFSKNDRPTITRKNGTTYSVQRTGLSFWDKIGVSRMYRDVCGTVPNMSGYYRANDGGHYYIRHIGTDVYWFGEHASGNWANIFKGKLDGNKITGQFYDVPKGRIQGSGTLKLTVNYNSTRITKTEGANFGGSVWNKTTRPANLPPPRAAGFGGRNNINNLTARWIANDGGRYYIRQIGNRVVWFGERNFASGRPGWANVAYGSRFGNTLWLDWVDVPKGNANSNGILRINVDHANRLTRVHATGGFGGSVWTR
ncbi:M12 family metallopeptidase [Aquimarina algicola]|uniref:Peptidase M12A domain-containing protein n=1 Tax=Aquimarina algicola TaxID=2589995 RepID=A0A504J5W3_9FLAO|nr:M12 family metallopeptidase [Aquimarina algicola]TPN85904.1 hypothetical protein FHK87_11510 [Aquimarina algicola]